jgi:hypothetical protein
MQPFHHPNLALPFSLLHTPYRGHFKVLINHWVSGKDVDVLTRNIGQKHFRELGRELRKVIRHESKLSSCQFTCKNCRLRSGFARLEEQQEEWFDEAFVEQN